MTRTQFSLPAFYSYKPGLTDDAQTEENDDNAVPRTGGNRRRRRGETGNLQSIIVIDLGINHLVLVDRRTAIRIDMVFMKVIEIRFPERVIAFSNIQSAKSSPINN